MENTQPVPGFRIEKAVSAKDVANLLCSGFEGGVGYWCRIEEVREPKEKRPVLDAKRVYAHTDYPLLEGGAVICRDIEEQPVTDDECEQEENEDGILVDKEPVFKRLVLDREAVQRALNLMSSKYPRHWGDFLSGNYDAITGDVFIQLALLGDVIYG